MIDIDGVIAKLLQIMEKHGNLQLCRIGHFGEINEMSDYSFGVRNGRHGTFGGGKEEKVAYIEPPDIGPDPD